MSVMERMSCSKRPVLLFKAKKRPEVMASKPVRARRDPSTINSDGTLDESRHCINGYIIVFGFLVVSEHPVVLPNVGEYLLCLIPENPTTPPRLPTFVYSAPARVEYAASASHPSCRHMRTNETRSSWICCSERMTKLPGVSQKISRWSGLVRLHVR